MATDSPHRCRCVLLLFLFLFLLCFHHTLGTGWVVLVYACVLRAFFGVLVCVWNVFPPLSISNN